MDIAKIKNNLRFATPTELYDIAPGQVVYFASKDGLCQFELIILADLLRYFRQLHKYNDIKLSIVPDSSGLNVPPVSLSNVPGVSETNVPPISGTNVPGISL